MQKFLTEKAMFQHLVKASVAFSQMHPKCQNLIKKDLLRLAGVLKLHRTFRRKYICSKSKGKIMDSEAVKNLKIRILNKGKLITHNALENLLEKLKKYD